MRSELKIWIDVLSTDSAKYASPEYKTILFSSIKQLLGKDKISLSKHTYISVINPSTSELKAVKKLSEDIGIPIICIIEETVSKNEFRRLEFVPVTIEGDFVDVDSDGMPLNTYPDLACTECKMPVETKLPAPFLVSSKQILRRKMDGVPHERLKPKREVFWSRCGVLVVSERVKEILWCLGQDFISVSIKATAGSRLPFSYWAIRPRKSWGCMKYIIQRNFCPSCRQPREYRIDTDSEIRKLWSSRLIMKRQKRPKAELVCSETWFGDRAESPFSFIRPVFASGRLYEVLLHSDIKGLMRPDKFVAIGDDVRMIEDNETRKWIDTKIKLLNSEGLL